MGFLGVCGCYADVVSDSDFGRHKPRVVTCSVGLNEDIMGLVVVFDMQPEAGSGAQHEAVIGGELLGDGYVLFCFFVMS